MSHRDATESSQNDSKSYLPDSGHCSDEWHIPEKQSTSVEDKLKLHRYCLL